MKLYIPEDIVIDILIRIPAHHVIKLRRVCRRWKDIIRTKHFRNSHSIRSKESASSSFCSSLIIFRERGDGADQLSVIDKWEQAAESGGQIFLRGNPNLKREFWNRFVKYRVDYSQDGFVVMYSTGRKVAGKSLVNLIYNPITGETVMIKSKNKFSILALFFNPWLKQYCVIVKIKGESSKYEILNLSCLPFCRRALIMPILDRCLSSPVVINNEYIYWKVEMSWPWCGCLIIFFNIEAETFGFLPHPKPHFRNDCVVNKHKNMHIVKIYDDICFIRQECPVVDYLVLNVWTLIDSTKNRHRRVWSKAYKVKIDIHKFNVDRRAFDPYSGICKRMTVDNGELLLEHFFGGVFAYNFESGTVRKIAVSSQSAKFSMYFPSFASIRNRKSRSSVIRI